MQVSQQPPSVSVIVPARNCERDIERALSCLAAQDFEHFEVIVVDDGSTDATPQLAAAWCERDGRFKLVTQGHASAGAARNTGMAQARGDYLLFLDADDAFEPTMLSKLHAAAAAAEADIVMCAADCFTSDPASPVRAWDAGRGELACGIHRASDLADHLFQSATVSVWNKLFDARFVRAHGLSFQDQPRFNDAYFTLMALAHARTVCKIGDVLVHYRVDAGESLMDRAQEEPYCDIVAFDALRRDLERDGLLAGPLKRSLDTFCISTITWRLAHYARSSESATRALFDAFYGQYRSQWGLAKARWPYVRSARYSLECELMAQAGVEGLVRAAACDERTRASGRDVRAEARFVLRLAREALKTRMGAGTSSAG